MIPQLKQFLEKNKKELKQSLHGLEKECLRITSDGEISQTPHPVKIGSPLTNQYISTDFAECQLEFITPPFKKELSATNCLRDIKIFTKDHIGNELLWPFSMPARLPKKENDIPLAQYGTSREGMKKTNYRRGLSFRYGRRMQTISGIHYNFSFSEALLGKLYKKTAKKNQTFKEFRNEIHFHMIRNYTDISWLDLYLFGSSPACDKSYIDKKHKVLKKLNSETYYAPYGTSLRMSELGYCCQKDLNISLKNFDQYINDLDEAINTKSKKFAKIGLEKNGVKLQLNNHKLQIENEYYAPIRPKNSKNKLREDGVNYLEVRTVDLNPYNPCGVCNDHIKFLHVVMLYCLVRKNRGEKPDQNHNTVGLYGRKPGLLLEKEGEKILLTTWAMQILEALIPMAQLLGKDYEKLVKDQIEKIIDPSLTPSAMVLEDIKNEGSFLNLGLREAKKHMKVLKEMKNNAKLQLKFELSAKKSLVDQGRLEGISNQTTEGYEGMEVSTQLIIKEALKRKITVDILDKTNNFIRLSKGKNIQYVAQATKTSKDSIITYLIMENKQVTKIVLYENGINVPTGNLYTDIQTAISDYPKIKDKKLVVKPLNTNYGIAVSFPKNEVEYANSLKEAFNKDKSVIVEEFAEGKEYRFLVINFKTVSIVQRIPANVIGDGLHTIAELVEMKNSNLTVSSSRVSYPIRLGESELAHLKKQGLKIHSIPKKDVQILLRENTNVSTGGDALEVSHDIPKKFKDVAVSAAKAVNAKFCGVDMIINNDSYSIIELNFNPALAMHKFPDSGEGVDIEKYTLDTLGF